jgi:tetratricopeptide (TPR) repeat protein
MRVWLILAIAALLAATPDRALAAAWVEVRSPHFIVLSDSSERRAREVAWQFEQIRGAIVRLWPWAVVDLPLEVLVYAARDEAGMRALVPKYFEGRGAIRPESVFVSSPTGHFIALRSDIRLDSRGDINPYRSSYWSYMALVIRSSFGRELPLWYTRGLAEVFSNTVVRDSELRVGQLLPWHLERLNRGARPTLAAVLAADRESPFMSDADRMAEFDAAAWALVHYLMFGNSGQNLARMNQLSTSVRQGMDPTEALPRVYGSVEAVAEGVARYIGQSMYVYQKVPVDVAVDLKAFNARELPAPDTALMLARLHAAMRRPVEARAQIAAAAGAPAAAEVEALLLDAEDDREAARAAYARASEAAAASFYGEYRLATMLWPADDAQDKEDRFAAIEKSLRRAVALNPKFAPAHAMLAQTLARHDRGVDALPFAQRSVTLSPFDPYSHESLARAYWALGKREEAAASVKRALGYADHDATRKNLQQLLDFYTRPAPAAASPANRPAARAEDPVPADQKACHAGDAPACSRVFPVAQDACARGVHLACSFAAHLLSEGRGVAQDGMKAIELLEKPCASEVFETCTHLATLLARRQTKADLARAKTLLDKSCKGGVPHACELSKSLR